MGLNKLSPLFWLLFAMLLVLSFSIGRVIKDYPILELETKISIVDVINTVVTVSLAVFIPIYIRKFLERKDKRNDVVFDSLHDCKEILENLQTRFTQFYTMGKISDEHKTELYVYTVLLETKLNSFKNLCEEVCREGSDKLLAKLNDSYIQLWQIMTGETLNDSSYTEIDESTFKSEIVVYQSFVDSITDMNLFLID